MDTLFSLFLQLIDRRHFKRIVDKYDGDKHVRTLRCWDHFVLLFFGQINKCHSAREALAVFNSYDKNLYHLGTKEIARSTFSDAAAKRESLIFEDLYKHLVNEEMKEHLPSSDTKEMTTIIDATNIVLPCCARKDFPGSKGKAILKVHTVFCLENQMPENAFITSALVNDIVVAKKDVDVCPGRTYVFDKGYYDFGWWWKINQSDAKFVTRLKKHTHPIFVEEHSCPQSPYIISDHLIMLKRMHGRKRKHPYSQTLRRVIVKNEEGHQLQLVTNDLDRSAEEIARLYKDRWSIELFFKWIKQNLKIKRFYGNSNNAMRTQIFVALITYVLMKRFARLNSIKGKFIDFVRISARHLMESIGSWWDLFFPTARNYRKRRRKRLKIKLFNQLQLFPDMDKQHD